MPRKVNPKRWPELTPVNKKNQNHGWKKKHNGQEKYFGAKPGETRHESYPRCVILMRQWMADIDRNYQLANDPYGPDQAKWEKQIAYHQDWLNDDQETLAHYQTLKKRRPDTEAELKTSMEFHQSQVVFSQRMLENRVPFDEELVALAHFAKPPERAGGWWKHDFESKGDPVPIEQTIQAHIEAFLDAKHAEVKRSGITVGRYDVLRTSLASLADFIGGDKPLEKINSDKLASYREELLERVDSKKLSKSTARDHLANARQFIDWLYQKELIAELRITKSKNFNIKVEKKNPEVFDDTELGQLFAHAPDATKLYMLLMLNCGFQQTDIAGIKQTEVDWKLGTITRQRSKTSKQHGEKVPTVTWRLWPETLRLLRAAKSNDPILVLVNANGSPLVSDRLSDDDARKRTKIDNIRTSWKRLMDKLQKLDEPITIKKPLKCQTQLRISQFSRVAGMFAIG